MKTLYLDIFSGISGDMFVGAMLDLGVDFKELTHQLSGLGVTGYHLHAARRQNSSIEGVKFDVHLEVDHDHEHESAHEHDAADHAHGHGHHHHHEHAHRHRHGHHEHENEHGHAHSHGHGHEHAHDGSRDFAEIKRIIQGSGLSNWVKEHSISVFQRVAAAEGKVHGKPADQVHFHEVGAIDSIVDIVGACIALEMLGRPRVLAAPVVEGTGWVDCAHGRFPVPTTATLEILGARGIPVTQCEEPHELVTPTGAALLAEFAEGFIPMKGLVASRIGYGLGTRQNKTRPNVLRAVLGEAASSSSGTAGNSGMRDWEMDTVAVLETNLDDCNSEILGYFVERALAAGALDVFHTAIQMKKNRPAVLLSVLCAEDRADDFCEMLLRETTAFGVRRYTTERRKLKRAAGTVATPFGEIATKLGMLNGESLHATPEFESCRQAAEASGKPLRTIYEAAEQAIRTRSSGGK
jgi:pyridinium-3,5-bisthiocarboxylic acid mononucleotide nickel chelatase